MPEHQKVKPSDTQKKIRLAAYLMMVSTLLSRLIGFIREMVLAHTIGASGSTDVYVASFSIPDFINHLMAAGALSLSFVPILSTYVANGNQRFANLIFRSISGIMGLILLVLLVFCEIYAYELGTWIAPGFDGEKAELLAELIRIILPAQFFFYWGGLAIAIQYTHGWFIFPALAPLIYNLGIITFGIALHEHMGVKGFSVGVIAGCFLSHGVLQWIGIKKLGYQTRPNFKLDSEIIGSIKKYLWLTFPIMFSFSLVVVDEWVAKYLASYMPEGAISWLNYARREMLAAVAVIAQAAGIASFPFMSKTWAAKNYEAYGNIVLTEVKKLWAAAPLAAIIMAFSAESLTHLLFFRGKFTLYDVQQTAFALKMLSIGIFFWCVQNILARAFYACQNTWLPSLTGTGVTVVCLPIYWWLGKTYGFPGLALAGSIGMIMLASLLGVFLIRHLKRYCPTLRFKNFFSFCGAWAIYLVVAVGISLGIDSLEIYQQTYASAALELCLIAGTLLILGWTLIRTFFKRYTDGVPLF